MHALLDPIPTSHRTSSSDAALRAAGAGRVHCALVQNRSVVTSIQSNSPLKLLTPRSRGRCAWVVISSFGGGLVAGDQLTINLAADPSTRTYVTTQSATKIFRST